MKRFDKKSDKVSAKKHFGQHFLKDENIAQKIAETLSENTYEHILEIGPGMGVLTKYLIEREQQIVALDIDKESIAYLQNYMQAANLSIVEGDFLKLNLKELFGEKSWAITGNFPYNISSQIVFKVLEFRASIPEFSGMFQKEVAKRICEKPGSKTYGILSVLTQAFYDCEYLFTVHPQVFDPPPKVQSGVIRLKRKENYALEVDEKLFFSVVKTAFNQRRKTLRNSLKSFGISANLAEERIFDARPEQLGVSEFVELTQAIANDTV